jgi:hypothetical protein
MAHGTFTSTAAALLTTAARAFSYSTALQTKRPVDQTSRPAVAARWVGRRPVWGLVLASGTAEPGGPAAPGLGARPCP